MAILYFKIGMLLHWLAGNTHTLGQVGYNWSTCSMGKAINALNDTLVKIMMDGRLYLDESFMNSIFSMIHTNDEGKAGPLDALEEAMHYQYEEKQTPTIDGSKALPMDQLNAELFYPQRSTKTAQLMACEVAECILKELRGPGKATSDYLSSVEGKFSWGQTMYDEHATCIGKMATTDPAESPLASLTRQLQSFG